MREPADQSLWFGRLYFRSRRKEAKPFIAALPRRQRSRLVSAVSVVSTSKVRQFDFRFWILDFGFLDYPLSTFHRFKRWCGLCSGNTSREFYGRVNCRQCGVDRQKAVVCWLVMCRRTDFSAYLPAGTGTFSLRGTNPNFCASRLIIFGSFFK